MFIGKANGMGHHRSCLQDWMAVRRVWGNITGDELISGMGEEINRYHHFGVAGTRDSRLPSCTWFLLGLGCHCLN